MTTSSHPKCAIENPARSQFQRKEEIGDFEVFRMLEDFKKRAVMWRNKASSQFGMDSEEWIRANRLVDDLSFNGTKYLDAFKKLRYL